MAGRPLAPVGEVIVAIVMSRFKEWAMIVLAALVGKLPASSGLQMLLPSTDGLVASRITVILAMIGSADLGGLTGNMSAVCANNSSNYLSVLVH